MTVKRLSFLHIVPFDRDDPARGLEEALELFEYAEALGLDGGWIRTRHLQYGVPSAAVFLAAAAQRTRRIDLGVAVIPTGWESPLRLAEDLAVADLLSGGRLRPGFSVGPLRAEPQALEAIFGDDLERIDTSYARVDKIVGFIKGVPVDSQEREIGLGGVPELGSDRVEPHSPGLASRLSYGAGSLRSARYAGQAGLNLLVSNISSASETNHEFSAAQREQIDVYRAAHPDPASARVQKGLVAVPLGGTTAEQRERYEAYVAARTPRTLREGAHGQLIAPDLIGSADEIAERLRDDVAFQAVDEVLFEMPFSFGVEDYRQIIREMAVNVGPALGWRPAR